MYVILAYDVESRRTQIFKKICQRYLARVQNSVFEGELTKAQLRELQHELKKEVQEGECVRIWDIADNQIFKVHTIGEPRLEEGNLL
jgi:CRISPR-associated protein Cas2